MAFVSLVSIRFFRGGRSLREAEWLIRTMFDRRTFSHADKCSGKSTLDGSGAQMGDATESGRGSQGMDVPCPEGHGEGIRKAFPTPLEIPSPVAWPGSPSFKNGPGAQRARTHTVSGRLWTDGLTPVLF